MRLMRALLGLASLLLLLLAQYAGAAEPLPRLNVDLSQTTVSGLSSGAYMAGQFHVAFSAEVVGAGIVAGGPYGCAEGRLLTALRAMHVDRPGRARSGRPVRSGGKGSGERRASSTRCRTSPTIGSTCSPAPADHTVLPAVGAKIAPFYALAGLPVGRDPRRGYRPRRATASPPRMDRWPAATTAPPFVNDCDLDQAREILDFVHGPLQPAAATTQAPIAFDQSALPRKVRSRAAWPRPAGSTCRRPAARRALPGPHRLPRLPAERRERSATRSRSERATTAGPRPTDVVVLYPQTHATWSNPNGCWDWWGYTGAVYATKAGVQMAAVHRMLLALAGQADASEAETCVASRETGT